MKLFTEWLFSETPIVDFQTIGDWDNEKNRHKWDKASINIMRSEKARAKIIRIWDKTEFNFRLYLLKGKGLHKYFEIGSVSPEWVRQNLKFDIKPDNDSITIIYTQNIGSPKAPMTAWILAHRFAHVLMADGRRSLLFYDTGEYGTSYSTAGELYREFWDMVIRNLNELLKDYYGILNPEPRHRLQLFYEIGTMKSAVSRNIANDGEIPHEIFSQYLISGRVKFKQLPLRFGKRHMFRNQYYKYRTIIHDEKELNDYNQYVEMLAQDYTMYSRDICSSATGHIFVM